MNSWANIKTIAKRELGACFTLPLGFHSLLVLDRTNYPVLLAAAVVTTVPVVIVFAIAQRFFLHEDRGAGWLGR